MIMMLHCEGLTKTKKHTLRKAAAVQAPPADFPFGILSRSAEAEAGIIQQRFNLLFYMYQSSQNGKEPNILRGQTY